MSLLVRFLKLVASILGVLLLTVYFVRAYDSRNMPPLGPEYRIEFEHEFDASQESLVDWSAYLEIEGKLAIELEEKIHSEARAGSPVDRYSTDSLTFPGNYRINWNLSYEMSAPAPRGVAVLLHGLSDSPYSMRATAEALVQAGYNVVVPRMPGHGFAVGGLLQTEWEDWAAVVRIAVRHAMQLPGSDRQLLLGGYSNGGLMAVDYALKCADFDDLPCPDGLVLMSPSIAVTRLAAAANLHSIISWMPYFEKSKWQTILPEIDPFKFTSFPMRAGWEMYRFSSSTHRDLKQAEDVARLPPILTFQSVVDNTISATAVVTHLYAKLPDNGSELVIYDANRNSTVLYLMKNLPGDPAKYFASVAPMNFAVSILRNRQRNGRDIDIFRLAARQLNPVIEETDLQWPLQVYSLSHISLPFRTDDPVYGDGSGTGENDPGVVFGALAPRGEQGVLRLSPAYFLRTRYNPFFSFQESYMLEWLDGLPAAGDTK